MPSPTHPWPQTRTVDVVEAIHGKQIHDPYRWLEDETSPEVQAWMKSEDDYARGELDKLPGRDELAARMKQLLYFDAIGAPVHRGARFFYSRKHADKEKIVVYWKAGEHGDENILFDPNTWSADGSKGLHGWYPSWDGAHVAYQVSEHNSDETVMHVHRRRERQGSRPTHRRHEVRGRVVDARRQGLLLHVGATGRRRRVGRRAAGLRRAALPRARQPIRRRIRSSTRRPRTPRRSSAAAISRDGHWLFCAIQHGWNSSDLYFRDARKPGPWQTLVAGVDANFNLAEIYKDKLYIQTNDGAPRYRVFVADPHKPDRAAWKEIIPAERRHAREREHRRWPPRADLSRSRARASSRCSGSTASTCATCRCPVMGTVDRAVGRPRRGHRVLLVHVVRRAADHLQDVDRDRQDRGVGTRQAADRHVELRHRSGVLSVEGRHQDLDVHHPSQGHRARGTNPTILYGYGGFDVSMTPSFASSRVVWLEHGGVLRDPEPARRRRVRRGLAQGGHAAREAERVRRLHRRRRDPRRAGLDVEGALAISGGSNGGLLVGAVLTQRPELFKAVICAVPLLDMLRYHLFGVGQDVGSGVRLCRRSGAIHGALRVFAISRRGRRGAARLSGDAVRLGRSRRSRRSTARAQARRGDPGRSDSGCPDPVAHRT